MPLPAEFWRNERDELLALLLPAIEEYVLAGVRYGAETLAVVGITVDYSLTHAEAIAWARSHTDILLDRLNSTTRGSVGQVVANWLDTPGATRENLEARLLPILEDNLGRAESVGVTEVTRATAQGNYLVYEQAGVVLPPMFDSGLGDERFGPPAHPRCRCWPRVVRLPDNTWVVVWSTNRDELVCETRIRTPWGEVQGCRALHNVVLSEGRYLGRSLAEARQLARVKDG
jgi:hypothetical protein